jgi:hypothetical protein
MARRVNRKTRLYAVKPVESRSQPAYSAPGRRGAGTIHMNKDLSPKQAARKEREERLAAELRENLKRRKAQARARKASEPSRDAGER